MIHDVVGGAAHEELDRPSPPRNLALGVVRADGVETLTPMRREAFRGEDDLPRGTDIDLARELLGFIHMYVANDLVTRPASAAGSGAQLF